MNRSARRTRRPAEDSRAGDRGAVGTRADDVGARDANADRRDDGMTTAEYAVGLVAATGFAALLYEVVTSSSVRTLLTNLIEHALHTVG